MELIASGGWFDSDSLLSFPIKEIEVYEDIPQLEGREGFIVLSYNLTRKVLSLPVKSCPLPSAVFLELGKPKKVSPFPSRSSIHLKPKGQSLLKEDFVERVLRIKEYIASGDIYQVNLTNRFDFELEGSPRDLFLSFFKRQPVPYAFFLDMEDFFIISGSMELFLRKRGNFIQSKPIKGTGKNPASILESEKERAENLMITDMVRNDLGRVASTGSVRVKELFKVQAYATLCQMHSTVEAYTCESFRNILLATFPPASVTGAPKFRAVQIIDELEPHPRGYYCGSAGFIDRKGNFTLSVLIRTAFGSGFELSYFSGCGIVWDSEPQKEWEELLLKVKAFYP